MIDEQSASQTGRRERLQEEQYDFPYHYIPVLRGNDYSQTQYYPWGHRYLGRLQIVFEILDGLPFRSLVDVGCGDGRFLRDVDRRYSGRTLLGIDLSARAIAWARGMNPNLAFEERDITVAPLEGEHDVVTLLDVIEHVPPASLPALLAAAAVALRPDGHLIITVPSTRMPLDAKHYQHFDRHTLDALLAGTFSDPRYIPFDGKRILPWLLWAAMGGSGRHYVVTSRLVSNLLMRCYRKWSLHDTQESRCQRLACVARRADA